jgi:hypothetical protein
MVILTRVKIIDSGAEGYCSVGHISAISPEGEYTVTVENTIPDSKRAPWLLYGGLRADQLRETVQGLKLPTHVGRAQLLDVIRETHGYTPEQCEGILDYALRSEAVIELLLKTIGEDDDIMADELRKQSVEFQVRDEDYYGKEYAHLRKPDGPETVMGLLREIDSRLGRMTGDQGGMNDGIRGMIDDLRGMNEQADGILGTVQRIEEDRRKTFELLREIDAKMLTKDFLTEDDLRDIE